MKRYRIPPALMMAVGAGTLGLAIGVCASSVHNWNASTHDANTIAEQRAKIQSLTMALQSQSQLLLASASPPPASAAAATAAAPSSPTPPTPSTQAQVKAEVAMEPRPPAPPKRATTRPATAPLYAARANTGSPAQAAKTTPTQPQVQSTAAATAPDTPTEPTPPPIGSDVIAQAKQHNPIEGVNIAQAKISSLSSDAVVMHSGARVRIGERFPSGERLLAVEPTLRQIVTSQRTIILQP